MSRIHLSLPNAYTLMCFDRNINEYRNVKFLNGIIGHCTDERNLLQLFTSIFNYSTSGIHLNEVKKSRVDYTQKIKIV